MKIFQGSSLPIMTVFYFVLLPLFVVHADEAMMEFQPCRVDATTTIEDESIHPMMKKIATNSVVQDRDIQTVCEDTVDRFEVMEPNGKTKMKGCDWVTEMKTNWRCDRLGVRSQCPVTCNACCNDSEDRYEVSIGSFTGKMKTCTWAGEKVRPRCNDPAAKEACPSSCGTCASEDTPSPTPSPGGCEDSEDKYEVTVGAFLGEMKSCTWVRNKINPRCNDPAAKAACPLSCSACPEDTPSPTQAPVTSGPTRVYNWCTDVEGKFEVDSLWWIKQKKNCAWARKSNPWWKCTKAEVQDNCPETCNFCRCKNNQGRFKVGKGKTRSCAWAAEKDTWWRCKNIDNVRRNCPLLCGECEVDFPSVAPSSAPTVERFPSITVDATTEIALSELVIPEDPDELAQMKSALAESYILFLPEGTEIVNVEIVYASERQNTIIGYLLLTVLKVFNCTDTIGCIPDVVADAYIEEVENFLKEGVTGGRQSDINLAMQESFQKIGQLFTAVIGDAALNSIIANIDNVTNVDPTDRPTGNPSEAPSYAPSIVPSDSPSIFGSSVPSAVPSLLPSLSPSIAPSFMPSARPTKRPTIKPSPKPSSVPSVSVQPSLVPSQVPSLVPSTVPSLVPSTSLAPSLEPSQVPSLEESIEPSSEPSS